MEDNKKKIRSIFAIVLSLLLIIGLVVSLFFIYYKNGAFKDFYIRINDSELIYDYKSNYNFIHDETYKIEPIYVMDGNSDNHKDDYTVKVVSNDNNNTRFEFSNGDNNYVYNNIDFTDCFKIQKEEGYFTFKHTYQKLEEVIEAKYGEVTFEEGFNIDLDNDYLSLVVISYDESKEVRINFNVELEPQEIIVSEDHLIF